MERVPDCRETVEKDIRDDWMRENDPVNLQPCVLPLDLRTAEFIRANVIHDVQSTGLTRSTHARQLEISLAWCQAYQGHDRVKHEPDNHLRALHRNREPLPDLVVVATDVKDQVSTKADRINFSFAGGYGRGAVGVYVRT